MPLVATAVRCWVTDGVEKSMTWFNSQFKPEAEDVDEANSN